MREIKFRARRTEDGVWIYGSNVSKDTSNINTVPLSMFWSGIEAGTLDAKTLGQYIDRKAKNGKEIYEGDIVRCIGYVNLLKVRFSDGGFLFGDMHASASSRHDREIIGNIYENKELLKEVTSNAQI